MPDPLRRHVETALLLKQFPSAPLLTAVLLSWLLMMEVQSIWLVSSCSFQAQLLVAALPLF